MGVWIETKAAETPLSVGSVTPYVGVWIETFEGSGLYNGILSLLMWECGLKQVLNTLEATHRLSLLMWECGLKRNQIEEEQDNLDVTPYVGVWIETVKLLDELDNYKVTPYVGVWIETKTLPPRYCAL